jgi:hypothetical protein
VESESRETTQLDLTTKDISSAGAYLYCCSQHPVEGARVKMELLISLENLSKLAGLQGKAKIKLRGMVVRVDAEGIAIRFESKYKITALDNGDRDIGSR